MDEQQAREIAQIKRFPKKRNELEGILRVMHPDGKLEGLPFESLDYFTLVTTANKYFTQAPEQLQWRSQLEECRRDWARNVYRMAGIPPKQRGNYDFDELRLGLDLESS